MGGKRADLLDLVFGNLTVLLTWYRLEVPPMPLARADERFNKAIFWPAYVAVHESGPGTKWTSRG